MADKAPLIEQYDGYAPAVAIGDDDQTPIATAEYAGTVTSVKWIAAAAVTGAGTNTRKLDFVNKGSDGGGATVVATIQFDSGTDAAAMDETALAVASESATVADGDVLSLESAAVGTGLADPGGKVVVEVTRSTTGT